MPKPNKQVIIDAIIVGIEFGKSRGNLLATVVKKWQLSQRTFDRLWKIANEQHVVKQGSINKEILILDTNAAIEARKAAIMTAIERKEWLTNVINGNLLAIKTFVVNGELQNSPEAPNHNDRLKALAELNKMEGDYAPTRQELTGKNGNPIEVDVVYEITLKL